MSSLLSTLVSIASTQSVELGGKTVPLKSFVGLGRALPTIYDDFVQGKGIMQAIMDVEPEVLPVVEALANLFFPGAGNGIALVVTLLSMSHKMTPDEETVWFDRAKGNLD